MAKVTILDLQNLDNPNTAVSTINLNFQNIQEVIDTLLSRDGAAPNSMVAFLDMNANRILNLPAPVSPQEPARHGDIQQYVDRAEEAAEAAEHAQEVTEEARDETLEAYEDFLSRYIGSYTSDPAVDGTGQPLKNGAIYWNTVTNQLMVFTRDTVVSGEDSVFVGSNRIVVSYWIKIPQTTLRSLTDVDADVITNNQLIVWSGNRFVPQDPEAEFITFDNSGTMFNGSDVQSALEEVSFRTNLGIYDIFLYAQGPIDNGETLFSIITSRPYWLPAELPGTVAVCRINPNAATDLTFRKNGDFLGTVTFQSDGSVSKSFAGDVHFEEGDILTIVTPAPADTAIRDITLTIAARR